MKIEHQSTRFNFYSFEHGDITVTWQEAKPSDKYRWDVSVRIGDKIHTWNARMSPTRTGAIQMIKSSLSKHE